mmetsp:Transcript_14902/g.49503  ORF Transcript_14902/g.49503 Transcript_14902/m.49503 type:complete len:243 (+) Transcript_14902:453-1181(+)
MHDIVGIRRADDPADRAAEPLGEQPARSVAKGAGRDDKVDGPVGSGRDLLARPQVVARLHEHARPVDRVDRADGVAPHEGRVFEDALERLGLLVGVALRAVDEDVRAVHGHHLQLLHARHAPLRIQAEDAHRLAASHRLDGGGARVSGRLDHDGGALAAPAEHVVEQPRHDLLPDVLEGERRPGARLEEQPPARPHQRQRRLEPVVEREEGGRADLLAVGERDAGEGLEHACRHLRKRHARV